MPLRRPIEHVTQRIIAIASAVAGLGLILAPARYTSPTYSVAFAIIPARGGGLMMLVTALITLRYQRFHQYAAVPLLVVIAGWAWCLWAAVLLGEAGTVSGPVWPTALTILLADAIRRDHR